MARLAVGICLVLGAMAAAETTRDQDCAQDTQATCVAEGCSWFSDEAGDHCEPHFEDDSTVPEDTTVLMQANVKNHKGPNGDFAPGLPIAGMSLNGVVLVAAGLAETVMALNNAAKLGLGSGDSVQQLRALGRSAANSVTEVDAQSAAATAVSTQAATQVSALTKKALTAFKDTVKDKVSTVGKKYSHVVNLDKNLQTTRMFLDSAVLVWSNMTGVDNGPERMASLVKLVGQLYRFAKLEKNTKHEAVHHKVTEGVDHVLAKEVSYAADFIYKQVKKTTYDAVKQASTALYSTHMSLLQTETVDYLAAVMPSKEEAKALNFMEVKTDAVCEVITAEEACLAVADGSCLWVAVSCVTVKKGASLLQRDASCAAITEQEACTAVADACCDWSEDATCVENPKNPACLSTSDSD